MFLKAVFTVLFVVLLTTQLEGRIVSLKPGASNVVERKNGVSNQPNEEQIRSKRGSIVTELLHTHTVLEGDYNIYAVIHWSGLKKSNVVFILTFNYSDTSVTASTLWRSEDYAKTFTKQSSKFDSNATLDNFAISDTDHTKVVIGDSVSGVLYITNDEGATYMRVWVGQTFYSFDFYPGRNDVMVGYNQEAKSVWGSVDGGVHWFRMVEQLEQYQVGEKGDTPYIYAITGDDQRLYKINIQSQPTKTELDKSLGNVLTTFLQKEGDYIFVQKEENSGDISLWVSHSGNTFRRALFPTATYTANQAYYIVSVHNKQLLVLLTSSDPSNDLVGDLFLSDETGTFYTLSLENVLTYSYTGGVIADIHVVEGMNGTILANIHDGENHDTTTVITFDSGAEWSLIPAPSSDDCYLPQCSLHFMLYLSAYINNIQTTFYSRSSAVGVLVAVGSEGTALSFDDPSETDQIHLFVSTNGGVTWSRTHTGTWLVTFADHAGVVTAVKDYFSEQTTQLEFSLDEGANWNQYQFSHTDVTVGGLVTEPGEATLVDVLFAYDNTALNQDWEIVTVNYSRILSTPCVAADYFSWSPYNSRIGRDCLLGSSISWERKIPSSICYNGLKYERETNVTICTCSIVDYECDWGYKHTSATGEQCVVDITQPPNPYTPSCATGVPSYSITKGFRKIAGDVCDGGDTSLYDPTIVDCDENLDISFSSSDLTEHWGKLGERIEFNVIVTTTKAYTHFVWDFGEGDGKESIEGNTIYHTFKNTGTYNVQVFSSDYVYTYTQPVFIANQIQGETFSHLYGAQVGAQTVFNSFLTTGQSVVNSSQDSETVFGYTHFSIWYNITGKVGNADYLTQDFSFEHVFYTPGVYPMKVSVVGPLNTKTLEFTIQVFPKLFVLELKFSQIFNISQFPDPNKWLSQVQTAMISSLIDLNLITPTTELEINIQPSTDLVYLAFNVEGSSLDFTSVEARMRSHSNGGTFGVSIDSYHGSVLSVRDVTDLIQVDEGDYRGYAGAIVFLVLIVLTLAFLLTISVVIIFLIMRITKNSNQTNQTTRGANRNVYMNLNQRDDEMEPLNADSDDDEHLLPLEAAQPQARDPVDSPDV